MGRLLIGGTLILGFIVPSGQMAFGDASALSLTLQTDTNTYSLGTPVLLRLALKNSGTGPLRLRRGLDISYCSLQVLKAEGRFEEVQFLELMPLVVGPPVLLDGGGQLTGQVALLFRARASQREERRLIFGSVGEHTFRMRYVTYVLPEAGEPIRVELVSNEAQITVAPAEKGFQAFFSGLRKYTIDDARLEPEGVRWMQQFIKEYPESTYAQYAKGLVVACWCNRLDREDLLARVQADPQLRRWAEEVLTNLGSQRGFLSCDSLYVLALSHLAGGRPAQAEPLIATLRQEFPQSRYLKDLEELQHALRAGGRVD